jgi:DNA-binding FrmR family transcriptional regulator
MSAADPAAPPSDRQLLIRRLHRIEGQVRGIERMVENDRDTSDVLTQIAAARTALEGLALRLLEAHVTDCVDQLADADSEAADRQRSELLGVLERFARTH